MRPKKIWGNLAVEDLDRTTRFYSDLGFQPNGRSEELTSFFFGENKLILHFFLKDPLRSGMKGELADLENGNELIFSLSADTREEVDLWEQEVEKAGGTLISKAEEFGNNYYGFVFSDPDGHRFNVFQM